MTFYELMIKRPQYESAKLCSEKHILGLLCKALYRQTMPHPVDPVLRWGFRHN